MNKQTAPRTDWTFEELRDYFGFGESKNSRYLQREPFNPAAGGSMPMQMHETATHPGGVPVHLEGGVPAMTREMTRNLETIPYDLMREAVEYVRQWDNDAWRAMNVIWDRYPLDTMDILAERIGKDRTTLWRWVKRALDTISSYVDRELIRRGRS